MTKASSGRIARLQQKKHSAKWPVKTELSMTKGHPDKWRCDNCGHVGTEFLTCPNPFYPDGATLVGCPSCRSVNTLVGACYFDGCENKACGGTLHDERGYVWYCREHRPEDNAA